MSQVFIVMGSDSDWPKVKAATETLKSFGVTFEVRVLSAHRTPKQLEVALEKALEEGVQVFIAAAGQAAHLAGVVASHSTLPVIGLPIANGALSGQDSLYSTVMMPPGIPVATVGIDNSTNAALLAVQILAVADEGLAQKMKDHRAAMAEKVAAKDAKVQKEL
jgi:5-(carboxyamino)imidazole ribonucleotide mutase